MQHKYDQNYIVLLRVLKLYLGNDWYIEYR